MLQWQYAPVRNATAAAWSTLVLVAPFPDAVLVQWVSADQLVPIADRHGRMLRKRVNQQLLPPSEAPGQTATPT